MATTSRKIFIDTSVLTAFVNRGNPSHLLASKAVEDLASIGYRLYTSPQVISDSYAQLAEQVGTTVALEFLQTILQSGIEILFPQKVDLNTAYKILKVNRNELITLSEALNATLMHKKGISRILTLSYWSNLFGTSISGLAI